ncbi:TPA: hypothetical protein ACMDUA_005310 [Vibrio harveyi]
MATITDFDLWVDAADADGFEEVYALYQAVSDRDDVGLFKCEEKNGRFFVTANHVEDTLLLASDEAYDYFLVYIEKRFDIGSVGDMESWYGYQRAMAKDD